MRASELLIPRCTQLPLIQHYAHLAEQHFEAPDFNIDSGMKQQLSGDDVQTCRARQVHKFPKGAKR